MFSRKTEEFIEAAVNTETKKAAEDYGSKYASKHEIYAILKEEIEEAKEELDRIRIPMHVYWLAVRGLWQQIRIENYTDKKQFELIKEYAINTAKECIQIAAVCNKAIDTVDNKTKE